MEIKKVIKQYKIVIISMLRHKNFTILNSHAVQLNFNNMRIRIDLESSSIYIGYDGIQKKRIDMSWFDPIYRMTKKVFKECKKDALNYAWSMLNCPDAVERGSIESKFLQNEFNGYKDITLEIKWYDEKPRILLINNEESRSVLDFCPSRYDKISRKIRRFIRVCNYERKCRNREMAQEYNRKLADELYTKLFEEI